MQTSTMKMVRLCLQEERKDRMKILYTAEATVTGGREGHVRSSDGAFEANLSVPKEMGGAGGLGTNQSSFLRLGMRLVFNRPLWLRHVVSM